MCAAIRRVAHHAVNVNGGERFVEHPQRGAGQPQAGQRHPALAAEAGRPASSNPASRPAPAPLREARAVAGVEEYRFSRAVGGIQSPAGAITAGCDGKRCRARGAKFALPSTPRRRPGAPARSAEGAAGGFSRAVAAGDLHPLPCIPRGERRPAKQRPLTSRSQYSSLASSIPHSSTSVRNTV